MDDVIVLIRPSAYVRDAVGNQVPIDPIRRQVFATLDSIGSAEYFRAGKDESKPELRANVFWLDYQEEREAEVRGQRYAVYRTFLPAGSDRMELYLTRREAVEEQHEEAEG